jgi:hypothetical protein
LQKIVASGRIFSAHSDKDWVLDGATVHISIVCFDAGGDTPVMLDGNQVSHINPDLTGDLNLTVCSQIGSQGNVSFQGTINSGPFDIPYGEALRMLRSPNPTDQSNWLVVRPWANGADITRRLRGRWIIDFGTEIEEKEAARFEQPFHYVLQHIKPQRDKTQVGRIMYAHSSKYPFWRLWNPRPEMRMGLGPCERFLATPRVTKYRVFVWLHKSYLPDAQLIVFARSDDYFLGVLHSSIHELWARRMGTQLREAESGFRYTPTTCFETFPLPWPPGQEPAANPAWKRISQAAEELNAQRERWLNPPEWIDPIAKSVDLAEDFSDVPPEARPLIRQSIIMAIAAKDARLKKRTLTNLYNERPTWLRLAHEALDRAVLAAYAAADPEGGWSEDWAEVWRDTGAGQPLPADNPLAARRAEIDGKVLANLLRLNLARAGG